MPEFLSADEAARQLGISRASLYAYVSRGLLHSEAQPGPSRARRYRAADVQALLNRQALRRDPKEGVRAATQQALSWGEPTVDSALSLIADGQLYYWGQNASELAETATVEQLAALLWTGDLKGWRALTLRARLNRFVLLPADASLLEAYGAALNHAAAHDLHALEAVPQTASRVLTLLYAVTERQSGLPPAPDVPLHLRLARAWAIPQRADLLRRALVLCADHELNVSSFTARVAASGGASLHHAALAALCAFQGPRHGLMTARAYHVLEAARDRGSAALRAEGVGLPGFGHPLYPAGDPRAAALLSALPAGETLRLAETLTAQVDAELGLKPNLDFALAVLAHTLNLGAQQALALFVLGRSVGWLAHALESAAQGRLLRPRARYTGPAPETPL